MSQKSTVNSVTFLMQLTLDGQFARNIHYITKAFEMNDFLAVVGTIEDFWISIVKLPTKKDINK